jgi:Tfp pilus assembly protein PilV
LASESGFALVEVMVSAVLVVAFALATLSVIEKSGAATSTNRQRGVAVGLAQADQDSMRLMSLASLTNRHLSYEKKNINGPSDGTVYTIQSDAEWLRDAGGKVTCSTNATRAEYVKTTTKVTWTDHPAPVVMESYISPGVGGLAKGALTVKLKTDPGAATSGIAVTAGGQTVYTDAGGCAVFANLTPGPTAVSWSGEGPGNYVDRNGQQTTTELNENITISTAQTSQMERLFDHAGTIPVKFVNDAPSPVAVPWTSVSVTHSGITEPANQVRSFVQGTPDTTMEAQQLFPFVAPYSLFAGSCAGNAPTTWWPAATMPTAVAPAAAASAETTVVVPSLVLSATSAGLNGAKIPQGTPAAAGLKLVFKKQATGKMAGCSDLTVTTTTASPAAVSLPYGQYTLCVQSGTKRIPGVISFNNTPTQTTTGETQTRQLADAANPIPTATSLAVNTSTLTTGVC